MIADLALLGSFALVAAVLCCFARPHAVLAIAVGLCVLQLFITSSFAMSLATVWQVAAAVTVYRHRRELPHRRVLAAIFAIYLVLCLLAIAWSPDRPAGMALCVQLAGLGVIAALAAIVIARRQTSAALVVLTVLVAVSAASIVVFRFLPEVEDAYFHFWAFGFFNGHELADGFFTVHRNNALDKVKAGGLFFVNANAASLFCGAGGAIVAAFVLRLRGWARTAAGLVVVLDFAAVLATGSKTGLYVAGLAVLSLVGLLVIGGRRRGLLPAAGLAAGAAAVALIVLVALPAVLPTPSSVPAATAAIQQSEDGSQTIGSKTSQTQTQQRAAAAPQALPAADLANQSMDAMGTRVKIWRIGLQLFEEHPYGGFGYGGWSALYGPLAQQAQLNPAFPPHDWLIQVWSDTGLLSLLAVIVLIGLIAVQAVRLTRGSGRPWAPERVLAAVAIGWILIHGLADNTGVYGGPRLLVIAALAVAMLLVPQAGDPSLPNRAGSGERLQARPVPAMAD